MVSSNIELIPEAGNYIIEIVKKILFSFLIYQNHDTPLVYFLVFFVWDSLSLFDRHNIFF